MLLKIIETRAKLELQKDDIRDMGLDPESTELLDALKAKKPSIIKKSVGSLNQNATQMHADLQEDYQNKKAEYIIERLSEIKRWHNSVKNILENRVRDYNRLLEDLDPRYREIRENYKQKRALVRERRVVLKNMKVKVAKALEEAEALQVVPLTAEEIEEKERLEKEKQELQRANEQLSVGDSQISPGPMEEGFSPLKQGPGSFGEGKDQLPKYFNILNEEGIEKKADQDDQSNLAETRDLLKELDR